MTLTLLELLETIYWWTQQYLRNKLLWKLGISKYQLQIFCFHDTVYNEGIPLSNSDQCGDQVAHPARVDKVQMIQATQLVIIMKENPILVKESGGWSGKENDKFHNSTAQQVYEARLDLRAVIWSTIGSVNRVLIFQQYGPASSSNSTPYVDSIDRVCARVIGLRKIELCGRLNVLRLFQAGHVVYEMGEESFHVTATNSFHVKAENERFIAVQMSWARNLKLPGYVKETYWNARCPHSPIIFSHSTNYFNDLRRFRCQVVSLTPLCQDQPNLSSSVSKMSFCGLDLACWRISSSSSIGGSSVDLLRTASWIMACCRSM